jgi:DNA (cytosine-5)-methyltransferase 1
MVSTEDMNAPVDIRTVRLERKIPQAELARRAFLTVARLTRIERGLVEPSADEIARIGEAIGITIREGSPAAPALRGEGYRTAVGTEDAVIRRRREPDPGKLPVWDLFCGIGGFSAGFEAAGRFEVVTGIDLLGDRLDTFTANHSAATAYGGDIRNVSAEALDAESPRPFVIIGGPPCQGFSSIRPFRNIEWSDPRNNLGEEFCRVVASFLPEWIVFENVVGMLTMDGGKTLKAIDEAFQTLGYRTDVKVLNAAYHGMPQRRERLIIVGSRKGKAVRWPKPTHFCDGRSMAGSSPLRLVPEVGLFGSAVPAVTLMDAISDLPEVSSGQGARQYVREPCTEYQRIIRNGASVLTMHEATAHTPDMLNIIRHAGENINCLPVGMVTSGFSTCYSRLAPDEPANTITVNFVHPASNRCIHPYQHRALTRREGARVQGFLDTYSFMGTRSQTVKQIGNAVPPPLGRVIAEAILASD